MIILAAMLASMIEAIVMEERAILTSTIYVADRFVVAQAPLDANVGILTFYR